jgi:microcystin-dependent protein
VHSHANSLNESPHAHTVPHGTAGDGNVNVSAFTGAIPNATTVSTSSVATGISITNANAGSGNAHSIMQPTVIVNYILRVL